MRSKFQIVELQISRFLNISKSSKSQISKLQYRRNSNFSTFYIYPRDKKIMIG